MNNSQPKINLETNCEPYMRSFVAKDLKIDPLNIISHKLCRMRIVDHIKFFHLTNWLCKITNTRGELTDISYDPLMYTLKFLARIDQIRKEIVR